jgi:hypothetical protein
MQGLGSLLCTAQSNIDASRRLSFQAPKAIANGVIARQ